VNRLESESGAMGMRREAPSPAAGACEAQAGGDRLHPHRERGEVVRVRNSAKQSAPCRFSRRPAPTPRPAPCAGGGGRRRHAQRAVAAGEGASASNHHFYTAPQDPSAKTQLRFVLLVFALFLAPSPAFASSASDTLATAERAFAEGVELRNDSAKARPAFARAAASYDVLWEQGNHTPELALNRARAHRLAGNLPKCIAALHDGLAATRFSRALQVELDDARAAVQFPLEGELAAQCRPKPLRGVSTRLSPADAWFLAGLLWLLACACVARFAMARSMFWLAGAGLFVAGLLLLGGFWVQDAHLRERDESLPLLIVTDDAMLRKGNAEAFPPRVEPALPRGTEVRELARRGGWVQVQLPGGPIGWLPGSAVIGCGG
jgi:hypothetical protein